MLFMMLLPPLIVPHQLFIYDVVRAAIVSSYTLLSFLHHLVFSTPTNRLSNCIHPQISSSFCFLHLSSLLGHGIGPTTPLGGSSSFALKGHSPPLD
jgi:hypothetical protein